jgi:hypothetical protein
MYVDARVEYYNVIIIILIYAVIIQTGLGDDALLSEISQLQKTLAPNIVSQCHVHTLLS